MALLIVQMVLLFHPKSDVNRSPESAPTARKTSPLPGIVGGISLVGGLALYVSHRNKRQE
ncbi:MAG: hypothetical protein NVS9B4_08600 [Candidatus Acidiferrum sp.]